MDLTPLFRPRTIAVVGASDKPGFGNASCKNLLNSTFQGQLYFVNPHRSEVMGRKCFSHLGEIPQPIDLVIIATPKHTVNQVLTEAASRGCRAAVVYASGYSETGEDGITAEQELQNLAERLQIAVCGPNCAGFVNNIYDVKAFGISITVPLQKGDVAVLAQSGQVCSLLMNTGRLGFSYVISSGNNAVIDTVDYLSFLLEDPHTKVIALYLEGVKKPKQFVKVLAEAAQKRKPIVVLKTGISAKGKQIASSHTGSLAGSDATYNAIFKKFGVIRVYDMEELVTTCTLLSKLTALPSQASFAVLNLSGGEAAISADLAYLHGINLPDFQTDTTQRLKSLLPPYASLNNPLDMTATLAYDPETYAKVLRTVMADHNIGAVAVALTVPEILTPDNQQVQTGLCEAITGVARESTSKPLFIVSSYSGKRAPELRTRYEEAHVPILESPRYAYSAISHLASFVEYKPEERTMDVAAVEQPRAREQKVIKETLSEHESKVLLKQYGIPVTREILVNSEEELEKAADSIGYPVVLKIDSPDVPHKTDVGAVKLNIANKIELRKAYTELLSNVRSHVPKAVINGVLVQEMLPKGLEVIVGANRDEQFGPMIMIGLGGIFVELFKDVAIYPAPLNTKEAFEMINSLRSAALFKGYRGGESLDLEALASLVVNVSRFVCEKKEEISELDLNPVFLYPKGKGVCVADALMIRQRIEAHEPGASQPQ